MVAPAAVADSPLELIAATPIVRLNRVVPAGAAEVWAKLESFNPGGSIKDRICLAMIEAAEREGRLAPGTTVVEPTSGNTGIGLGLVCAVKGYELILTMPDTVSEERRSLVAAYGADLVLAADSRGMHDAIQKAEEIVAQRARCFLPQQFSNPANPEAHRRTTAREILEHFDRIDAFVAGIGTGGTITGVGEVLRERMPGILVVAVEPAASAVLSGSPPGFHKIQGWGAGFLPDVLSTTVYDEVCTVSDEDAIACTRRLAREEGILAGISSGGACVAAIAIAERLGPGRIVVTVFPDTGERYLTTDLFEAEGI